MLNKFQTLTVRWQKKYSIPPPPPPPSRRFNHHFQLYIIPAFYRADKFRRHNHHPLLTPPLHMTLFILRPVSELYVYRVSGGSHPDADERSERAPNGRHLPQIVGSESVIIDVHFHVSRGTC